MNRVLAPPPPSREKIITGSRFTWER